MYCLPMDTLWRSLQTWTDVWLFHACRCCYQLQDAGRLAVSQQRLQRAEAMLQAAHGPNQERLRTLHGNFKPEQAM